MWLVSQRLGETDAWPLGASDGGAKPGSHGERSPPRFSRLLKAWT
jgi:hypothetical protein